MSAKGSDRVANLNQPPANIYRSFGEEDRRFKPRLDQTEEALTGRMTAANESEGGDQEFGLEEFSGHYLQPDATFAPGLGMLSDRSKLGKSSVEGQQRDMLLLRCRDAIEELHHEIEEERSQKNLLQREVQEL